MTTADQSTENTAAEVSPGAGPPANAPQGCPHHGLGAQINLFEKAFFQDPHPILARLRREEPIAFNPMVNGYFVTRYNDIHEVLKDPVTFSSTGIVRMGTVLTPEALAILSKGFPQGDNLLITDPPVHTRLRRLLNRGFTPPRVAAQEPQVRAIANNLIDAFIKDGRADLVGQFADILPVLVILTMVGVPAEDMAQIKRWSDDWFELLFHRVPPEAQPPLAESVVAYHRYCYKLIEERRKAPREDLTSYLASAEPDGEALSIPELIAAIGGSLLAAGHETTTGMIASTVWRLLSEPGLWEEIQREPALLNKAIEECLRYECIVISMMRTTTRDVDLGGVHMPKGTDLFLFYLSANRDEDQFPEADRFNIHRAEQPHLGFGRFTHFCLGSTLARLEIEIALKLLLERLPDLRLVPDQTLEYRHNATLRGLKSLLVEWRAPSQ
jgi:cytochrome P450